MNSYHQQTKKYIFAGGILALVSAVLLASSYLNSERLNLFGKAQIKTQTVKAWNFDRSKEGWKTRFTRDSKTKNGNLEIRIGQTFFAPLIFNRKVFTQMPLPLKYFSIRLALQKRKEVNIPTAEPTPIPADPLTIEDIQLLSLPEQTNSPSATDQTLACTAEMRTCPDGTLLPRVPPSCDFLPCPVNPSSFFTFDLQLKLAGSPFWSKPIPITGKISSNFQEFTVKLPIFNPVAIEAIKIEMRNGIGRGDIVLIDSLKLLNDRFIPPTSPPSPTPIKLASCNQLCSPDGIAKPKCAPDLECTLIGPSSITPPLGLPESTSEAVNMPIAYLCRNPNNPSDLNCGMDLTPTPTPAEPCIPPPSCASGGITDEQGNRLWCDPPPDVLWCPSLETTVKPCIPRPPCADGIDSPDGYRMYCRPPDRSTADIWCPLSITPQPGTRQ
ncbi:hypothetical protein A2774_00600 [Candidatus Roizmanbacteria bacterium RIFCSPHIGHO2_01_FULL_39_12c]|uniref:Uncharacterized protein n=1 Tax=Candidatus Roizmanbacteria bacterium RIFCSPHIGHO2_01_FULL_39_12c TaxID=1802031 RepID=A0A1F7GA01_9BACT|nr:MAG: hypothetical protein A2774_00600 [Candidatus Roizmanbacteria bacterium RIFCSPHIGHO2_01_FULL_39_12c]OGK47370.1 MAG: hypothetical protein A2963_04520 [Candidatus Roizmanbacteria bacterium RIFCSPLOWO2_01_FULL_40_13]